MKIIGDGSPNHYMVLVNFRRQVSYAGHPIKSGNYSSFRKPYALA